MNSLLLMFSRQMQFLYGYFLLVWGNLLLYQSAPSLTEVAGAEVRIYTDLPQLRKCHLILRNMEHRRQKWLQSNDATIPVGACCQFFCWM